MIENAEVELKNLIERIRNDEICRKKKYIKADIFPENREALVNYCMEKWDNGNNAVTMIAKVSDVRRFLMFINKPVSEIGKEAVLSYVTYLKSKGRSETTIADYKDRIMDFFTWLAKGKIPNWLSWMTVSIPRKIKTAEMMLTSDEIKRMVDVADNFKFKAMIMTLFESGCRLSEFSNLKIKDLEFNDYGCRLTIRVSKTKARTTFLVDSVPFLKQWLNVHPIKNDNDASLWVTTTSYHPRKFGKPMKKQSISWTVKTLGKMAGINKKRIYCHLMRHSRASQLGSKISEQVLKKLMGWTENSRMLQDYVHLNQEQVEEELLSKVYGIKLGENGHKEDALKPIICKNCFTANPEGNVFCFKCMKPIHSEKELLNLINESGDLLEKLIEKKLNQILKEKGLIET